MKAVLEFTYPGDILSAGRGTRCGWVKFRECGELLHGKCPLDEKGVVYKSYERPIIL